MRRISRYRAPITVHNIVNYADGIPHHADGIVYYTDSILHHADGIANYADSISHHADGIVNYADSFSRIADNIVNAPARSSCGFRSALFSITRPTVQARLSLASSKLHDTKSWLASAGSQPFQPARTHL